MLHIDSASRGDPARHLDRAALDAGCVALGPRPTDSGTLRLLCRRHAPDGRRELPPRAWLSVDQGLPGDAWSRALRPRPEAQLAVIDHAVAGLVGNGQPLSLFGDNLFVDLDLSEDNLPVGSCLQVGEATVVVTPKPHLGCRKFAARFGPDALAWVADPAARSERRRGVYWRVVVAGPVAVGDPIRVIARGP